MFRASLVTEDDKKLGTIHRSIMLENRTALRRRWALAQNDSVEPKHLAHWFPGQRHLFDILRSVEPDEVDLMADCTFPLFSLKPMGLLKVENAPDAPETNPVDVGRGDEAFAALLARLDAVRTAENQAKICYAMRAEEVKWIDPFCPLELRRISFDPSVKLHLATSDKYFVATACRKLKRNERSILAVTARSMVCQ